MKVVVTKEMTFSSGRHHVIQTSQFPAYFAKRKMEERMILIIMQSIGKVQKSGTSNLNIFFTTWFFICCRCTRLTVRVHFIV